MISALSLEVCRWGFLTMSLSKKQLSFYLVGEDALVTKCAEALLGSNHQILGVFSNNRDVLGWLSFHSIKSFTDQTTFYHYAKAHQSDFLLSVVNPKILSDELLQLPRVYAINLHNSLLPKYAGLNSSTWAIINNERYHGVSWHIMQREIDTGGILVQQRFPIAADDTAQTLNLKCYEHALASFGLLIKKLEENNFIIQRQDIIKRTYFGVNEISAEKLIISPEDRAEDIERLYRALSFNAIRNEVVLPKIFINGSFYIVKKLKIDESGVCNIPGVIIDISDDLLISTQTKNILIGDLETLDGKPISIESLVAKCQLMVGKRLDLLSRRYHTFSSAYVRSKKRFEADWIQHIHSIKQADWPFSIKNQGNDEQVYRHRMICSMSFAESLDSKVSASMRYMNLLSATLIFLYKIADYQSFTVWYAYPELLAQIEYMHNSYFEGVPFTFASDETLSFNLMIDTLSKKLFELEKMGPIERELPLRYPEVRHKNLSKNVLLLLDGGRNTAQKYTDYDLVIKIDLSKNEISLMSKTYDWVGETKKHLLDNMLNYISSLHVNLLKHPDMPISRVPILSMQMAEKLVSKFNKTPVDRDLSMDIYSLVQNNANPNDTAIIFEGKTYTYQRFYNDIDKVSKWLCELRQNQVLHIPILFQRSYELMVCIMAILKEGCTYVCLDLGFPQVRIDFILNDCNAKFLLTHKNIDEMKLSCLDNKLGDSILIGPNKVHSLALRCDPDKPIDAEDAGYIIYTSGTTGQPKGVIVSKRNILNYYHWFNESFELNTSSRVDFSCSIAFDLSVPCTLVPLMRGATVVICPENIKANPKKYLQHLHDNKVTHIECTPGYFSNLLKYPVMIKLLSVLKWVLLGAEALVKSDVAQWLKLQPTHKVVNEYGPTECTVAVTKFVATFKNIASLDGSIPIGTPSFNNQVYILDKFYHHCPIGIPGQIVIGGKSVCKGYLNRDQLNKKSFMDFPVFQKCADRQRVYLSGDMGLWHSDGNIEYLYRLDSQVKVLGYRVELDEIYENLKSYPGIQHCYIALLKNAGQEKTIVAYIVNNEGAELTKEGLDSYLKAKLPLYMLPQRYYLINQIPLTINEKRDTEHLHSNVIRELCLDSRRMTPRRKILEKTILDILEIDFIQNDHDFISAGLNSLRALRLLASIEDLFHIKISLTDLFENMTIDRLLMLMSEVESKEYNVVITQFDKSPVVALQSKGTKKPLFLLHPLGGGIFWYSYFKQYIDPDRPLYAITDPALESKQFLFNTLDEMIECYCHWILKTQPQGPYYLAGASFGSTLSVVIADRLIKMGHQVNFVGLFDGWAQYPSTLAKKELFDDLMKQQFSKLRNQYLEAGISDLDWFLKLQYQREMLLQQYHMPAVDFKLILFKADNINELFKPIDDPTNGWSYYSTLPVEVVRVPGDHEGMFDQNNVGVLVGHVNNYLKTSELHHGGYVKAVSGT